MTVAVFLRCEGQEYCTLEIEGCPPTYKFPIPIGLQQIVATYRKEDDPLPYPAYEELIFDFVAGDEDSATYQERLQFRGNYKNRGI